jgi:hypothetical protein
MNFESYKTTDALPISNLMTNYMTEEEDKKKGTRPTKKGTG